MTTIDEKEELELQKLKLEVQKFLNTDSNLELKKFNNELYKSLLLTIAVTTAVVTAFFKIIGA